MLEGGPLAVESGEDFGVFSVLRFGLGEFGLEGLQLPIPGLLVLFAFQQLVFQDRVPVAQLGMLGVVLLFFSLAELLELGQPRRMCPLMFGMTALELG